MVIIRENVTLRHITPAEGKVIHKVDTEEYYPEGLYLGKEENEENYVEVDISEVPVPEAPEEHVPEPSESGEE